RRSGAAIGTAVRSPSLARSFICCLLDLRAGDLEPLPAPLRLLDHCVELIGEVPTALDLYLAAVLHGVVHDPAGQDGDRAAARGTDHVGRWLAVVKITPGHGDQLSTRLAPGLAPGREAADPKRARRCLHDR